MNALTVAQYSKKKRRKMKSQPQEALLVEAALLVLLAVLHQAKVHLQVHLVTPLQSVAVHQPVAPADLQRRAAHLAAVHQSVAVHPAAVLQSVAVHLAAVLQSAAVHLADLNAAHLSELTEFSSTKPGFFQTS
jgi:hypothetical protein